MVGKSPESEGDKSYYDDCPEGLVVMKAKLGANEGISRAYFSDYLVKKEGDDFRIFARFDFSVTWDPVTKISNKEDDFKIDPLAAKPTTQLLPCHAAALRHETSQGIKPWEAFRGSILP